MKKTMAFLASVVFGLALVSGSAFALTIDFGYHGSPTGAVITDGVYAQGQGISIDRMIVFDNPGGFNGTAIVDLSLNFGYLPGGNYIYITDGTRDWLTGTFSKFEVEATSPTISINGSGPDTKAAWLLDSLNINPNTNFEFFGFTIATSNEAEPGHWYDWYGGAYSVDIGNTAVPEPTSLLLLGLGLIGLAGMRRK